MILYPFFTVTDQFEKLSRPGKVPQFVAARFKVKPFWLIWYMLKLIYTYRITCIYK